MLMPGNPFAKSGTEKREVDDTGLFDGKIVCFLGQIVYFSVKISKTLCVV